MEEVDYSGYGYGATANGAEQYASYEYGHSGDQSYGYDANAYQATYDASTYGGAGDQSLHQYEQYQATYEPQSYDEGYDQSTAAYGSGGYEEYGGYTESYRGGGFRARGRGRGFTEGRGGRGRGSFGGDGFRGRGRGAASYAGPPAVEEQRPIVLYDCIKIYNIPLDATEDELAQFFIDRGLSNFKTNFSTGNRMVSLYKFPNQQPKGEGFVGFTSNEDAAKAIAKLSNTALRPGVIISIEQAMGKSKKPAGESRGGGARGRGAFVPRARARGPFGGFGERGMSRGGRGGFDRGGRGGARGRGGFDRGGRRGFDRGRGFAGRGRGRGGSEGNTCNNNNFGYRQSCHKCEGPRSDGGGRGRGRGGGRGRAPRYQPY